MTKLTYTQQLAHPLWQRRRLEMLSAADWKCTHCRESDQQLHVHHRQYFKGRMAWEYSNEELQVLCSTCHEHLHVVDEQIKSILCRVPPAEVLALLAGFYSNLISYEQYEVIYRESGSIYDAGGVAGCLTQDRPQLLAEIYKLIVAADMGESE
jgi:hypothetical protein